MGELIKPTKDFLGRGLITPLRRLGASDFLASAGVPLVRASIRQICMTRRGEIPWKPAFGLSVDYYRHKPNTEELETLLVADIESSIRKWEPRVDTLTVEVQRSGELLVATITWSIINKNVPGNQVVLGPDTFEVTI